MPLQSPGDETFRELHIRATYRALGSKGSMGGTGQKQKTTSICSLIRDQSIAKRRMKLCRRREVIQFCRKLEAYAADLMTDPAQSVVDNVERLLVRFSAQNGKAEKSWREIVGECHDNFANPYQPGAYVTFGLQKLDFATGGIKRTNVCVIGAETSGGKTALALHVARTTLIQNLPVAFFSLEMSEQELAERVLTIDGAVSMRSMRKRSFSADAMTRINDSFARMVNWPCFLSRALSLKEIIARIRQLKLKHDLRLAIIDYLQLVDCPHQQTREREVAEVSRALKQLAMELDISVIALTQLNDDGRVHELFSDEPAAANYHNLHMLIHVVGFDFYVPISQMWKPD